ncbi:class I SAM-dependent methyltransferase [Krasilnikovia sp. MM14-A1259]|uniref:class I SAM-dependent methyltransferase n=1 Tax=Krasilnikovia sp. MM14-A1259 TaxID=3373539 RepID=UPI00382CD154
MHGYVARTLAAYEQDPERYERATRAMDSGQELDRFVALLPDRAGPVLDAGCAFGRDSASLAARGVDVVGVDLTPAFIARARQLHPELRFGVMDVCELDFPDATFAGVWCQATLLHLVDEHVAQALTEFGRVLRPGGALYVSFKEGDGEEFAVERFSSDGARFFRYQSVERVRSLVAEAGLDVVEVIRQNERDRHGAAHRDITWLQAYAHRPG